MRSPTPAEAAILRRLASSRVGDVFPFECEESFTYDAMAPLGWVRPRTPTPGRADCTDVGIRPAGREALRIYDAIAASQTS